MDGGPVAVVGLLKELGASPSLTIAIQGESLLNDGTAIVLFTIAYDLAAGKGYGPYKIVGFLIKSTLGSVTIGGVVGVLAYLLIRSAGDRLIHQYNVVSESCLYRRA